MTETRTESSVAATDESHSTQYDRLDDQPLSVAIAKTVAAVCNDEVTDLEPLYYTINAEALERLFEPRADGLRSNGSVTFEYHDCLVTVSADGQISVVPDALE